MCNNLVKNSYCLSAFMTPKDCLKSLGIKSIAMNISHDLCLEKMDNIAPLPER